MEYRLLKKKKYVTLIVSVIILLVFVPSVLRNNNSLYMLIIPLIIIFLTYLYERSYNKNVIKLYNKTKLKIENNALIFIRGDLETIITWDKIKDIKIKENSKCVKEIILITNQNVEFNLKLYENKESIKNELNKYMIIYNIKS